MIIKNSKKEDILLTKYDKHPRCIIYDGMTYKGEYPLNTFFIKVFKANIFIICFIKFAKLTLNLPILWIE